MKYALFLGCNIPARVSQYETSSRAVLKRLDIEPVDIREFNCCGYPLKNLDRKAFVLSAASNMALAEKAGLDLLVLCKCGYGTFKEAEYLLKEHGELKREINRSLHDSGLNYEGRVQVKHLLSVLYHDVGIAALKSKISRSFKNLKIATHYGCHALRPSAVTRFDDPVAPTVFDELVRVTGAKSVDWATKLECCGAPLMGINDELSVTLTTRKLEDGRRSGADFLCTACPYCQIQFDTVQKMMILHKGNGGPLGAVLYSQLLGLSMGMDAEALGISMNRIDISNVTSFLSEET